jgi:hypothetical protein
VTNEEMSGQVSAWLGLQDIVGYDETQLVPQLLQQGTIDLLSRTRCVVRCVQLRVQAGQEEYTLDHGILALVDVENGDRYRARRDEDPCASAFTLIRSDVLIVKPTPSEDGTIQVWGVMRPQRMQLPTDSPADEAYGAIPDEFHDAIVTYALWKGADYSDDASSQQGERYRTLYEGQDGRGGRLAQIRTLVNKRGTAKAANRRVRLRPMFPSGTYTG